jgi:hypothetical protein
MGHGVAVEFHQRDRAFDCYGAGGGKFPDLGNLADGQLRSTDGGR